MLASALGALVLAACAHAPASTGTDRETQRQVALTRSALTDASEAARAYGQAHLGHFLNLNLKRLQREGLRLPESISLSVRTTHTSFCIVAANEALPSIHPWARASVSSRGKGPSGQNRCNP